MDKDKLQLLLEHVSTGATSVDEALHALRVMPYADLGCAMVDSHRALRKGYPEVIYCQGKSVEQFRSIVERLSVMHHTVVATRASREMFDAVRHLREDIVFVEKARAIVVGKPPVGEGRGLVLIITAGTSDIPVAEEAALTAEAMGCRVERLFDVGVAGIHRLFDKVEMIFRAQAIVVCAGMDGALPSIVGGLAAQPVIAVPTSIGYGVSFGGVAALLTMLNSCAPGVSVMNIDNGFGAGYLAGMINNAVCAGPAEGGGK
jgi:pyridinium-3,5-biscarboxylic acid mononucleotide synthase